MTTSTTARVGQSAARQPYSQSVLTSAGWQGAIERLDRVIADASRAYLQELRGRGVIIDPPAWTRELDRLTRGRALNYGRPGLPLMYAVRYMPRRVISLLGALAEMSPNRPPRAVTDIGSGTGATVVAVQLLSATTDVQLTGIDASSEMVAFARHTQTSSRHPATFVENTIESLIDDPEPLATAELVTFSAPFNRAFDQWTQLASALNGGASRSVLAVEPESRAFLLDGFERALRGEGWQTRRSGSGNLPDFMKAERQLPSLTRLWRKIGAPGAYQPQTWWEPPADEYLIASRSSSR